MTIGTSSGVDIIFNPVSGGIQVRIDLNAQMPMRPTVPDVQSPSTRISGPCPDTR
jgi:hypothetical protein